MEPTTKTLSRMISGKKYTERVAARWEPEINDWTIHATEVGRAELAMAARVAEIGAVDGESFSWMRGVLGLQAKVLAELLDVRPETVSRWENGAVPVDRTAWFALSELVLERAG